MKLTVYSVTKTIVSNHNGDANHWLTKQYLRL